MPWDTFYIIGSFPFEGGIKNEIYRVFCDDEEKAIKYFQNTREDLKEKGEIAGFSILKIMTESEIISMLEKRLNISESEENKKLLTQIGGPDLIASWADFLDKLPPIDYHI